MLALAMLAVLAAVMPWSAETDRSTYVAGPSYIQPGGFSYPFGDYFEMDIDDRGDTHAVWGEGLDYQTPGSIWYTRGRQRPIAPTRPSSPAPSAPPRTSRRPPA
jgi:hypothetical protein